jgi:hypothetical protein
MKLGKALMVLITAVGIIAFAVPAEANWRRPGWHGWSARVWWGPHWGWGPRWGWWGPRVVVGYPYGYWGYPYPAYGYPPPPAPSYSSQQVYNGRRVTNDGKETPTQGD